MALNWQCILNPDTDALEIDEPVGLADLELSLLRDDDWHGVGSEASTGVLQFYGDAFDYLKNQKENYGLKADVTLQINQRCDDGDYEEIISGKLNFGKYKETCGQDCFISLPLEKGGCEATFKSRFNQKVDLDNNKSFDGVHVLPQYDGLAVETTLPAKAILAIDYAETEPAYYETISDQPGWIETEVSDIIDGHIGPAFQQVNNSSFGTFNPEAFPNLYEDGANNRPPYLIMPATIDTTTLLGTIKCNIDNVLLEFRLKGSATLDASAPGGSNMTMKIKVFRLPVDLDPSVVGNWVTEYDYSLPSLLDPGGVPHTVSFDVEDSVSLTVAQGDKIYFSVYIRSTRFAEIDSFIFNQDTECYFKCTAETLCEDSEAELYLVHETLSRAVESVTDSCMRVYSSYYGRTDSEPFAFDEDGCGGLRTLTSGLKIRKAEDARFFASPQDLLQGLNNIDNIGFGIEDDPDLTGMYILRIEDLDYFYKDAEIFMISYIPASTLQIQEQLHYAKILIGYKKWEVENINGLDEFNSNREYRTSLSTIKTQKDLQSLLVAGGYAIEITRQNSFADSGAADTTYDNEIFIICMERDVYPYSALFKVEQGNITNDANIFSPDTIYNYRISPIRNLMRWYRSLINSYPDIVNSDSRLFFSSGTGNLLATGEMTDTICRLENMELIESQDLFKSQFDEEPTPLWKNEFITFDYPLSVSEYNSLKASPYGYISYQCGRGEFKKGFIKEIKYKPAEGQANFTLITKWE